MSSPPKTPDQTSQQGEASSSNTTRTRGKPTITVQFKGVTAHTAKCDVCNKRNRDIMMRCVKCGWQCCEECLKARSGGRAHDTFAGTHVPA